METISTCPDCQVTPGNSHEKGCDVAICSCCGTQKLFCACLGHDPAFARWTGYWPGSLEAKALGMTLQVFTERCAKYFWIKPIER